MRTAARGAMGLALVVAIAAGEDLPPLPEWTESDLEKLESGELVPGQYFFGEPDESEDGLPLPLPEEPLPATPANAPGEEEFLTEIADEFLEAFFSRPPRSEEGAPRFLIDPQELLAQQDFRDRESFLRYHAGESAIDMFVYLFDARQELPDDVTLPALFEQHFADGDPCAVIFYHLGVPDRAQLILSREVRAAASEDEQARALRAAVQEAFEKSDPAYQLDNFLVELSIRFYWIEREMAGATMPVVASGSEKRPVAAVTTGTHQRDQARNLVSRIILLAGFAVGLVLLGWLGASVAGRRVRYVFPEVETGPLLGAPHAAGVGAVLSFSSNQIPPSQQRDEVPDYLQRM